LEIPGAILVESVADPMAPCEFRDRAAVAGQEETKTEKKKEKK